MSRQGSAICDESFSRDARVLPFVRVLGALLSQQVTSRGFLTNLGEST